MNGYLIDSNILINSNRYYKQKFFPVVWSFYLNTPNFYMMSKVFDELTKKDDELCSWTKANFTNKTIKEATCVPEYARILNYIQTSHLWTSAGYQLWADSEKADPWLLACALKNSYTIITDERNTGPNGITSSNEPKIPFVADKLGVKVVSFWNFLDENNFVAK